MMKLETYRKKLVVFFLLCSLMASTFISCNGGESAVDDTSGSTEDTTVQETEKTINITDQKFSGEEFNIAYMTGGSYGMGNEVDYTFEESQASAITASVYERNLLTEEYLDITINGTFIDPAGGNFNTTILNLVQSGDAQYDAICNYLRYNYQLVQQNALLNIRAIDSFCLENPWWDQTGAILNVMGYYSVDTITESVIQNVVMLRNTRDEISENMIRIALANKTYDIGLCLALGDYVNKVYGIISSNSNTFVSTMESIQPQFETAIGELIAAYGG